MATHCAAILSQLHQAALDIRLLPSDDDTVPLDDGHVDDSELLSLSDSLSEFSGVLIPDANAECQAVSWLLQTFTASAADFVYLYTVQKN